MNIQFDHVVHLTENPSKVKEVFQDLGLNAIKGGQHPNWGTHNCLCFFNKLRYIEWIGIMDHNIAEVSDNVLIQEIVEDSGYGEGFSQIAFRTNEIEKLAQRFIDKGLTVIGPVAGSRKREDGSILNWSMLFIKKESIDGVRFPFFIQWGQPENIRIKEMDVLMQHNECSPELTSISFLVDNPQSTVEKYQSLFDIDERLIKRENDQSFGPYLAIHIGGIDLKFFIANQNKNLVPNTRLEKPFICEISSALFVKTVDICGGLYKFTK